MKENMEYSRSYVQNWLKRHGDLDAIPANSAARIFTAATKILNAGIKERISE